jgi:hypothetical protein
VERSPTLLDRGTDGSLAGGTQLALGLRCSCTGGRRSFPMYAQLALNISHLPNDFVTSCVESDERHFQQCVVDLSSHKSPFQRAAQLCLELIKCRLRLSVSLC